MDSEVDLKTATTNPWAFPHLKRRSMRLEKSIPNSSGEELSLPSSPSPRLKMRSHTTRIAEAVVIPASSTKMKSKSSVATRNTAGNESRRNTSGSTSTLSSATSSVLSDAPSIFQTPDTSAVNTPAAEQPPFLKKSSGKNKKRKRASGKSADSAIVVDTASLARLLQDKEDAGPSKTRTRRRGTFPKLPIALDDSDDDAITVRAIYFMCSMFFYCWVPRIGPLPCLVNMASSHTSHLWLLVPRASSLNATPLSQFLFFSHQFIPPSA